MMIYGESDYWVALYRSLTEGSPKQAHSADDRLRPRKARGSTGILAALVGGIARRIVKERAGLNGRA